MMKKAQGALEFLMTYGWAFLVILIMIGALAYFGVLSPTKFLPERCTFGSQFLCKDYKLVYNASVSPTMGEVVVKLQNNLGQAIYVYGEAPTQALSPEGFGSGATPCTIYVYDSEGVDIGYTSTSTTHAAIPDGAFFTVAANGCSQLGGMTGGSKYKVNFDIAYYAATSSSAFSHTVQGEVFATVEEIEPVTA